MLSDIYLGQNFWTESVSCLPVALLPVSFQGGLPI